MTETKYMAISSQRGERGAVLIVSLIMLVLISIIAFTNSRSALMEERMAGHALEVNRAFQAAEEALRTGEASVVSSYPNVADSGPNAITVSAAGSQHTATWEVEVISSFEISLEAGAPIDSTGVLVRVIARSVGLTGTGNIVLESTYLVEG